MGCGADSQTVTNIDRNNDGKIQLSELEDQIDRWSKKYQLTSDQLMYLFDEDQNGYLDKSEYEKLTELDSIQDRNEFIFKSVDIKGKGKLQPIEIVNIMQNFYEYKITAFDVLTLTGKDEKLEFADFMFILNAVEKQEF